MRIAVIDVGTNTTRLYIAEVESGAVRAQLARESHVTRLGAGVDSSGRLAADALARTHGVLAGYRSRIEAAGVDRAVAVMTSAVRDAANGQELADAVNARYGIDARILTGEQEARLTYLGAVSETPPRARGEGARTGPTLVVDIGGGSTEMVIGHGATLVFHVSTQAGVVRQADRHLSTDPPSEPELDAVAADVRAV
ncbi:MAG: Ppx/GppA phosphatase family protein, partial [Solirubrobacteraceae bacterium]